jgi:hypothetical protein
MRLIASSGLCTILAFEIFRVLTVTTDKARIEKMLEALNTITGGRGSNMFLFTDQVTLATSNPLEVVWIGGKGESVRITD